MTPIGQGLQSFRSPEAWSDPDPDADPQALGLPRTQGSTSERRRGSACSTLAAQSHGLPFTVKINSNPIRWLWWGPPLLTHILLCGHRCVFSLSGSSPPLATLNPRQNHRRGLTFQCPPRPRAPHQVPSACGSPDAPLTPVSLGGTCPLTQPVPRGSPCSPEGSGSSGPRASRGPAAPPALGKDLRGPDWALSSQNTVSQFGGRGWFQTSTPSSPSSRWAALPGCQPQLVPSDSRGKGISGASCPRQEPQPLHRDPPSVWGPRPWSSQPQRPRDWPQQSWLLSSLRGSADGPGKCPHVSLSLLTVLPQ